MVSKEKKMIIDNVEYSDQDVAQMKRLKKELSCKEKFEEFRKAVSLIKKHDDTDVGMVLKIKE
tara:strand:- start:5270 stop:5458 length:189 start_codon:yes stop_codon:yes gene_type:complete